MNDIQTHFNMLMSPEEQERIGATPDKSDSMRVMRVLSEYDRMRDVLEFIRDNGMTSTKELIVHMANHALANGASETRGK